MGCPQGGNMPPDRQLFQCVATARTTLMVAVMTILPGWASPALMSKPAPDTIALLVGLGAVNNNKCVSC